MNTETPNPPRRYFAAMLATTVQPFDMTASQRPSLLVDRWQPIMQDADWITAEQLREAGGYVHTSSVHEQMRRLIEAGRVETDTRSNGRARVMHYRWKQQP